MNATQLNPAPISREHDADGRTIGLVYDSTPPLKTPEGNPWLIAVDGSENAMRAIAFAVRQAGAPQACALHLVHAQPWLSKEASELELAHRALRDTAPARAALDAAELPWRLHVAMGDPAERILERSRQLRAVGIVIGSRGLNVVESMLFGSVAYKVLHLSAVPVTVVP